MSSIDSAIIFSILPLSLIKVYTEHANVSDIEFWFCYNL
jgi:hypothetical protein